jgi:hypothetical protein
LRHSILSFQNDGSLPQKVELKRVTFKSSGLYRCEVTAAVRKRGGYGYNGLQGFHMKESLNRMTVVGE